MPRAHLSTAIVAGSVLSLSSAVLAQCEVLLQDTFRFGLRPHGGNGQLRAPDVGDGLNAYWPQLPSPAVWTAGEQGWIFAAASTDPLEVDPLDPFNGVAFIGGGNHSAALLPFAPPADAYTLSFEVALGQLVSPAIKVGYTSSSVVSDNFDAFGVLWLGIGFDGAWQLFASGATVLASGQGDYTHSLESGWLPCALTIDPAASTASGVVGGDAFGPVPIAQAPFSHVGFEAAGNFFNAVNNFRIVRGKRLTVAVQGPLVSPAIGGTVTLTAGTNAASPFGIAWRHDGSTLADGVTASGSMVSGASTSALTISGLTAADAGRYDAVVFNACGTKTSADVVLTFCYANCDGSTAAPVLTANDFQCFLNRFASGNQEANCDGSTGTPALTANDFQCFINTFAAGCP